MHVFLKYKTFSVRFPIFTSETALRRLNLHWFCSRGSASSTRVPVSWKRTGEAHMSKMGERRLNGGKRDEEVGTD